MLFTSGTAGLTEGGVLTHGNLIANLHQMLAVPGMMLGEDDVGLAAVPLFHVFGLNVVLGLTLATGRGSRMRGALRARGGVAACARRGE